MQTVVRIPWPIAALAWAIGVLWRIAIVTLALVAAAVLVLDELLIGDEPNRD
jgi:hypothetical protein